MIRIIEDHITYTDLRPEGGTYDARAVRRLAPGDHVEDSRQKIQCPGVYQGTAEPVELVPGKGER